MSHLESFRSFLLVFVLPLTAIYSHFDSYYMVGITRPAWDSGFSVKRGECLLQSQNIRKEKWSQMLKSSNNEWWKIYAFPIYIYLAHRLHGNETKTSESLCRRTVWYDPRGRTLQAYMPIDVFNRRCRTFNTCRTVRCVPCYYRTFNSSTQYYPSYQKFMRIKSNSNIVACG